MKYYNSIRDILVQYLQLNITITELPPFNSVMFIFIKVRYYIFLSYRLFSYFIFVTRFINHHTIIIKMKKVISTQHRNHLSLFRHCGHGTCPNTDALDLEIIQKKKNYYTQKRLYISKPLRFNLSNSNLQINKVCDLPCPIPKSLV